MYGSEYLSDLKIGSLDANERSCWLTLLCLASISTIPGNIEYLTVDVLFEKSGVRHSDRQGMAGILGKFERMSMIKVGTAAIEIVNWGKRQDYAMSVTERVRKYRFKLKQNTNDVTKSNGRNESVTIEQNRTDKSRTDKSKKATATAVAGLPDWIDKKVWATWVQHRKEKRRPLTPQSIKLQVSMLTGNKDDHVAIIETSIKNGWTGLFPLKPEKKAPQKSLIFTEN